MQTCYCRRVTPGSQLVYYDTANVLKLLLLTTHRVRLNDCIQDAIELLHLDRGNTVIEALLGRRACFSSRSTIRMRKTQDWGYISNWNFHLSSLCSARLFDTLVSILEYVILSTFSLSFLDTVNLNYFFIYDSIYSQNANTSFKAGQRIFSRIYNIAGGETLICQLNDENMFPWLGEKYGIMSCYVEGFSPLITTSILVCELQRPDERDAWKSSFSAWPDKQGLVVPNSQFVPQNSILIFKLRFTKHRNHTKMHDYVLIKFWQLQCLVKRTNRLATKQPSDCDRCTE